MLNPCVWLQIAQAAAAVRNHAAVRDFLDNFSRQPREHIHSWIAAHAKDLASAAGQTVLGGKGTVNALGHEEIRRSETFRGPWVEEALIVAESHRNAMRFKSLQEAPTPSQGQNTGSATSHVQGQRELRSSYR